MGYEFGYLIKVRKENAGDFNTKSPQLNMNRTKNKGRIVMKCVASHDLDSAN